MEEALDLSLDRILHEWMKLTVGQVFLRILQFSPLSTIPPELHTHPNPNTTLTMKKKRGRCLTLTFLSNVEDQWIEKYFQAVLSKFLCTVLLSRTHPDDVTNTPP